MDDFRDNVTEGARNLPNFLSGLYAGAAAYLMQEPEEGRHPWWRTFLRATFRTTRGIIADISTGQLNLRAMSLVYTTLLSLVPLLAISFSVLKGFGVHNQIEPFLLNALAPLGEKAQEITTQIISFVDNTKVGVLGFVGLGLLFYTVISLMQKIEHAFNHVWRVTTQRTWSQRFRDYLSVIIVGPTLIFTSLGAVASLVRTPAIEQISNVSFVHWLIDTLSHLAPAALVIAAFTFIYSFIPNTSVRFRSALLGGFIAGILWNLAGWFFAAFIAQSATYAAVYSSFATPIVFMLWLYIGWLILLLGASIAFYDQHPEYAAMAGQSPEMSPGMKERTALLAAAAIGRDFYAGRTPLPTDVLADRLKVPIQALDGVLAMLEKGGLLTRTSDEPPCYVPGRPWETTTVAELMDVVRASPTWVNFPIPEPTRYSPVEELLGRLNEARNQTLGAMTLKDLSLNEERKNNS